MSRWNAATVMANSKAFAAGEAVQADIRRYRNPTVCVALESLGGSTDDTPAINLIGDAGTYEIDSRTLSAAGSYVVEIPQAPQVEFTSPNGVTYSVEVRSDPTG